MLTSLYTPAESIPLTLQPRDYVLDVVSMLDRQNVNYKLSFRKILWLKPLKLSSMNTLMAEVLYHQAVPDWLRGHLHSSNNEDGYTKEEIDQIAFLAALQHRVSEETEPPNMYVGIVVQ